MKTTHSDKLKRELPPSELAFANLGNKISRTILEDLTGSPEHITSTRLAYLGERHTDYSTSSDPHKLFVQAVSGVLNAAGCLV